jgi:HEXXH motif-containing protein
MQRPEAALKRCDISTMFADLFAPTPADSVDRLRHIVTACLEATVTSLREAMGATVLRSLDADCGNILQLPDVLLAWRPELGHLNSLLSANDRLQNAAAQYALLAIAAGCQCDIVASTVAPACLSFSGYRIPTGARIGIHRVGDRLSVIVDEVETTFIRNQHGWRRINGRDESLRQIENGLVVVGGPSVDPQMKGTYDGDLSPALFAEAAEQMFRSLRFISEVSPEYFRWCTRVLRQVELTHSPRSGVSFSRSDPCRPGTIVLSFPADLVLYLEAVVHECTHQYFYMLMMLTAVKSDPFDQTEFFSSIVARNRPIDRVLLAYHATANIISFLDVLRKHRLDLQPMVDLRLREQTKITRQLHEVLASGKKHLSEAANSFWLPFQESVGSLLESLEAAPPAR